jgi:hypothetical protein
MKKADIHRTPEEKLASNTEGVVSAVNQTNTKIDEVNKSLRDINNSTKNKSIEMTGFAGVMKSVNTSKDTVARKIDEVKSANLATNITLKKILDKPVKEVQKVEVVNHKADKEVQKIELVNEDSKLAGQFFSLLRGQKGDRGEKGEKGDRGEAGKDGSDGKDGKNGKDGKDALSKDGKDGRDGKDGNDGSPDTPDEVVGKINEAKKKIKAKQVEGLSDLMRDMHDRDTMNQVGYSTGVGDISLLFFAQDISSQCDGSNKTFTIPQNRLILSLSGTQFPLTYAPTTDFTISGVSRETLTLTSAVSAPEAGQTLIVMGIRP